MGAKNVNIQYDDTLTIVRKNLRILIRKILLNLDFFCVRFERPGRFLIAMLFPFDRLVVERVFLFDSIGLVVIERDVCEVKCFCSVYSDACVPIM